MDHSKFAKTFPYSPKKQPVTEGTCTAAQDSYLQLFLLFINNNLHVKHQGWQAANDIVIQWWQLLCPSLHWRIACKTGQSRQTERIWGSGCSQSSPVFNSVNHLTYGCPPALEMCCLVGDGWCWIIKVWRGRGLNNGQLRGGTASTQQSSHTTWGHESVFPAGKAGFLLSELLILLPDCCIFHLHAVINTA